MPSSKSEAVTPRAFARSPSRSYRSPRRPNSTSMMMFLETPDLIESCSCVSPRSMRSWTMRAPTARRRFSHTFTRLGSSWLGRVGTSLSYQARHDLTETSVTPGLLFHAVDELGSSHTERVRDINQALKGNSAPTTFDSFQDADQESDRSTQLLHTDSTLIPQSGDARSDVTTPALRDSRATGSRRGIRTMSINFVHSPIVALLVGHKTRAANPFHIRRHGEVVSYSCHI